MTKEILGNSLKNKAAQTRKYKKIVKVIMKKKIQKGLNCNNTKKAFSLIELSIIILIISVAVAGILSSRISSVINDKVETTRGDRIQEIYTALKNYLVVNGRLPCPASLIIAKSSSDSSFGNEVGAVGSCSGSGVYQSTSYTNLVYGMVPIRALGLPNEAAGDGFGSKIGYVVDKRFTSSANFGTVGATSTITIKERSSTVVTNDAIFVLISFGANKAGAFDVNSSSQNTRSSDSEELNNDLSTTTTPYFDNIFISSSSSSSSFDDIIFYKTRDDLIQDSESPSSALSQVKCASTVENLYSTTITWPQASFDEIAVASTSCPAAYSCGVAKPTKKCGANGVWGQIVNACELCSCTLTNGQNFGVGAYYDGSTIASQSAGTVITLKCKSNYGSVIATMIGSRTTNTNLDCGETAAGGSAYYTEITGGWRTNTSPTITCQEDGTWSSVQNDCVACRDCSFSKMVGSIPPTTTYEGSSTDTYTFSNNAISMRVNANCRSQGRTNTHVFDLAWINSESCPSISHNVSKTYFQCKNRDCDFETDNATTAALTLKCVDGIAVSTAIVTDWKDGTCGNYTLPDTCGN